MSMHAPAYAQAANLDARVRALEYCDGYNSGQGLYAGYASYDICVNQVYFDIIDYRIPPDPNPTAPPFGPNCRQNYDSVDFTISCPS